MGNTTIRPLQRKDRVYLSDLIVKLTEVSKDDSILSVFQLAQSKDKKDSDSKAIVELGISIIKKIYELLQADFCKWLCDLIGATQEEFDEMPFDIEIKIIKQIVEREEFVSFFVTASELSSMSKKLKKRFSGASKA